MNELTSASNLFKAGEGGTLAVEAPPMTALDRVAALGLSPAAVSRRPDPAFSFGLRGGALNPLVDSSSPMIALILRIFSLGQYDDIDGLHKRCKHEIESVELELHRLGYDRVTILAHRYCLCSVIDETVMCSPWGQDSNWSERSLLATFHDETWGGEKYFVILERLMMEPARYLQILEFLYLCLCLGYEGKYRVMHNGRTQLEALIKEVHDIIRKERGIADPLSTLKADHIVDRAHYVRWQTPIFAVVAGAFVLAAALYAGFFFYTENYTNRVIAELTQVLADKD
ncbi:type IVB secretion system protein IcmH/DotU [Phyllobacterium leguminum]|uniref:Type VI secretion system protein ImpK n=1 Tax=Phyllobacterium leguminum TaxID=314237 RepID=A0A318STI0_9HYPH|nr:type IVB secretion system protein IcmH/DotU [Phyllobacterium leguminum]PYE85150.1 type VI secretion system protein ImpK [Phyllobacterium leguminum]